ncbi:transforming growth factor-beta-induced protein ig-h3-like [Montipora foliosa]|uniref:transforming growth factor-beta-induced protein ig-h3-like n=1 Tax=Montipora foliosa TaxID=591990 RepID=UPI0035F1B8AE
MAQLSWFCLLMVASSLEFSSSKWWSPYQWRNYWQDWWETSEKGQTQPQQNKHEILTNGEGPNVCVHRIPVGFFRRCVKVPGKRRLQCRTERRYLTEYCCCPGYSQEVGSPGCPKELYTSGKSITEVAESLKLKEFVKLWKASGLSSELDSATRYTVFAPNDQALSAALPSKTLEELANDKELLRDTLMMHISKGKIVAEAMADKSKITSLDGSGELWVNVINDGERIVIQGGQIVRANQGARNGVIHVVDRLLKPTVGDIQTILKSDPNFSIFSQMVENAPMNFTNITLFAPTDLAFQVMDPERLERLISNEDCVERFVKYHMLPKPLYSAAMDNARFVTVEGNFVDVKLNGGGVTVNDATVTDTDVTASNGIVHTINKVLMPVSAMNIIEVAHVLNLTTLIEYLNSSGLSATLSEDLGPITLFAPSNKAFEELPASVKRTLRDDPAKLQDILSYHLILERKWTYEFGKDNLVNSANIPNKLRLNSFRYGKVHAVDGACITKANIEACNGVIHVIQKVLLPPTKTVYDVIRTDSRFATLIEAINVTKLGSVLRNPSASLTLFAPTDRAFAKLEFNSPGAMEALLASPEELSEVLEHHVVNGTLYTCGIHCMYSYWSFFRNHFSVYSLSRGVLRMKYDWSGRVFVNGMRIRDRDLPATNGVVHVIDDVLELYPLGLRRHHLRAHSASRDKKHRLH